MDGGRFDDFARALAGRPTRRATVRAALAGLPALLTGGEAAAGCFLPGRRCRWHSQCCSGRCRHGFCTDCRGGAVLCGRECLRRSRLRRDPDNCGRCGRRCRRDESCRRGKCRPDCRDTDQECGDDGECCSGVCNLYSGGCAAEVCAAQGAGCVEDSDCCSGICDPYRNLCSRAPFGCNEPGGPQRQCPGGQCCDIFTPPDLGRCVYRDANPADDAMGLVVCGDCEVAENCHPPNQCRAGVCESG